MLDQCKVERDWGEIASSYASFRFLRVTWTFRCALNICLANVRVFVRYSVGKRPIGWNHSIIRLKFPARHHVDFYDVNIVAHYLYLATM